MHYVFTPEMVCSQKIEFDLHDGIVSNLTFTGGCNGNLKAIGKLLEGQKAEHVIEQLKGITCGRRPTSCSDQLTKALEKALAEV